MKFKLLILSLVAVVLCGCMSTPTNDLKADKLAYNGTAVGLALANIQKPFPPEIWAQIQQYEATERAKIAAGQTWINANPQFANTPGMTYPGREDFSLTFAILSSYIPGGVVLIP